MTNPVDTSSFLALRVDNCGFPTTPQNRRFCIDSLLQLELWYVRDIVEMTEYEFLRLPGVAHKVTKAWGDFLVSHGLGFATSNVTICNKTRTVEERFAFLQGYRGTNNDLVLQQIEKFRYGCSTLQDLVSFAATLSQEQHPWWAEENIRYCFATVIWEKNGGREWIFKRVAISLHTQ